MKKLFIVLTILIFPNLILSQVYRDVYSNGIYFLSDDNNPQNNVKWVSPTITSSITFTLPPNFGQSGYAMSTLGNGSITWTDVEILNGAAAGSTGQIQFNNSGAFGASANLFWDNNNKRLGVGTGSPSYSLDINHSLSSGLGGNGGGIVLFSEQANYKVYITAPTAMTSSVTYSWPATYTSSDQILATDGNGNLYWTTSWPGAGNGGCVGEGEQVGGTTNTVSGSNNFIGGGENNESSGSNNFIGGGLENICDGNNSSILSGRYNEIGSLVDNSIVGGGESNTIYGDYSIIFSGKSNKIDTNATSSLIGAGINNYVDASYSGIGSGEDNIIESGANYSFIGAGKGNELNSNSKYSSIIAGQNNGISASYSSIGAGTGNSISGNYSTILSGQSNTISGDYSFIAAGTNNNISGDYSIILGRNSTVTGNNAVAFGRNASANHNGSFVFADASTSSVSSSTLNQLTMRFTGGIVLATNTANSSGLQLEAGASAWTTLSDRNIKSNILELNSNEILKKINKLKIFSWSYIGYSEDNIRNYGPMAQDFYELFGNDGIGRIGSDVTISSYDLSSIGVLGVQAIKDKLTSNKIKITEIEYKNELYKEKLEKLKDLKKRLEEKLSDEVSK